MMETVELLLMVAGTLYLVLSYALALGVLFDSKERGDYDDDTSE